ncbi:MAG: copper amine oxidase N-terminal domain-containing protein [Defluviitaleaceae bacterium]|nr:copper amine oxidase N-terminal domain-containing protein [Defluviitaleaceae bacterium]
MILQVAANTSTVAASRMPIQYNLRLTNASFAYFGDPTETDQDAFLSTGAGVRPNEFVNGISGTKKNYTNTGLNWSFDPNVLEPSYESADIGSFGQFNVLEASAARTDLIPNSSSELTRVVTYMNAMMTAVLPTMAVASPGDSGTVLEGVFKDRVDDYTRHTNDVTGWDNTTSGNALVVSGMRNAERDFFREWAYWIFREILHRVAGGNSDAYLKIYDDFYLATGNNLRARRDLVSENTFKRTSPYFAAFDEHTTSTGKVLSYTLEISNTDASRAVLTLDHGQSIAAGDIIGLPLSIIVHNGSEAVNLNFAATAASNLRGHDPADVPISSGTAGGEAGRTTVTFRNTVESAGFRAYLDRFTLREIHAGVLRSGTFVLVPPPGYNLYDDDFQIIDATFPFADIGSAHGETGATYIAQKTEFTFRDTSLRGNPPLQRALAVTLVVPHENVTRTGARGGSITFSGVSMAPITNDPFWSPEAGAVEIGLMNWSSDVGVGGSNRHEAFLGRDNDYVPERRAIAWVWDKKAFKIGEQEFSEVTNNDRRAELVFWPDADVRRDRDAWEVHELDANEDEFDKNLAGSGEDANQWAVDFAQGINMTNTWEEVLNRQEWTLGLGLAEDEEPTLNFSGRRFEETAVILLEERSLDSWNVGHHTVFTVVDADGNLLEEVKISAITIDEVENLSRLRATNAPGQPSGIDNRFAHANDENTSALNHEIVFFDREGHKVTLTDLRRNNSRDLVALEIMFELSARADFSGDVYIEVSGGALGNAKLNRDRVHVATFEPAFFLVTETTEIQIGYQSFPVADITIIENYEFKGEPAILVDQIFEIAIGEFGRQTATTTGTVGSLHNMIPFNPITRDDVSTASGDPQFMVSNVISNNRTGHLEFTVNRRSRDIAGEVKLSNLAVNTNRNIAEGYYDLIVTLHSMRGANDFESNQYPNNMTPLFDRFVVSGIIFPNYVQNITEGANRTAISEVRVYAPSTYAVVDGVEFALDAPIINWDGRLHVPLRFISNILGITDEMFIYNDDLKQVTIFTEGRTIVFAHESESYWVNGIEQSLMFEDGTRGMAFIDASIGRFYLPFRHLGNALGIPVSHEGAIGIYNPR